MGGAASDLTDLQTELLRLMGSYRDMYYPECSPEVEGPEVRRAYCLHALNHVLKANSRVLAHNARLKEAKGAEEEEFRDQGLTRPKVLILVPTRDGALRVVQTFISLLEPRGKKMDVSNKKRFKDEFGEDPNAKRQTCIGRTITTPCSRATSVHSEAQHAALLSVLLVRRHRRVSAGFADAAGLWRVKLSETLTSCPPSSLLVLDQADVFLMQNWEHVLHVMKHVNLQPLDSHGVDFSRVRMWNLNNWAGYYRQTLVFSAIPDPQISSILTKHSRNYRGQVATKNLPKTGSICQVLVQLPHVFQMFQADGFMDQDTRFQFFVEKVLPQYRDSVMSHTLIYVPSYFGLCACRLKSCSVETTVWEFSVRLIFRVGPNRLSVRCDLNSVRFLFVAKYTIKGIQNLVFYALPTYAHFYSEMCNMLQTSTGAAALTCTALYSRYDTHRLLAVTGAERAAQMVQSNKSVHLFITERRRSDQIGCRFDCGSPPGRSMAGLSCPLWFIISCSLSAARVGEFCPAWAASGFSPGHSNAQFEIRVGLKPLSPDSEIRLLRSSHLDVEDELFSFIRSIERAYRCLCEGGCASLLPAYRRAPPLTQRLLEEEECGQCCSVCSFQGSPIYSQAQLGDITPPVCPRTAPGSRYHRLCLATPPRKAPRGHPDQMSEPPQLAPLNVELMTTVLAKCDDDDERQTGGQKRVQSERQTDGGRGVSCTVARACVLNQLDKQAPGNNRNHGDEICGESKEQVEENLERWSCSGSSLPSLTAALGLVRIRASWRLMVSRTVSAPLSVRLSDSLRRSNPKHRLGLRAGSSPSSPAGSEGTLVGS
ncbi:hypothetical protein SRHO_G00034940 [Serrasalmus rhombeus]